MGGITWVDARLEGIHQSNALKAQLVDNFLQISQKQETSIQNWRKKLYRGIIVLLPLAPHSMEEGIHPRWLFSSTLRSEEMLKAFNLCKVNIQDSISMAFECKITHITVIIMPLLTRWLVFTMCWYKIGHLCKGERRQWQRQMASIVNRIHIVRSIPSQAKYVFHDSVRC